LSLFIRVMHHFHILNFVKFVLFHLKFVKFKPEIGLKFIKCELDKVLCRIRLTQLTVVSGEASGTAADVGIDGVRARGIVLTRTAPTAVDIYHGPQYTATHHHHPTQRNATQRN